MAKKSEPQEATMTVYEDLVVRNAEDVSDFTRGRIKESDVRQTMVHFMADTGAHRNVITRDVFERLGLRKKGEQAFKLAGGQSAVMDVSHPMELIWRDRRIELDAAIAPAGANNLLSITAMELLDIMPNPSKGCLVGIHGDEYLNELE
jgi:predicted aspartyl protease